MKKLLSRLDAVKHCLFDKDVMVITWPDGLSDKRSLTLLMTATNNPMVDDIANHIVEFFKEKK